MVYKHKEMPLWVIKRIEENKKDARKHCRNTENGVCIRAQTPGPKQSLVNEQVVKTEGAMLALEDYAKEIQKETGCSRFEALDRACKQQPLLYERYTNNKGGNNPNVGKSATDEIMELIAEIMRLTRCDMERAAKIVANKHPDLYSRYSEEIMNRR